VARPARRSRPAKVDLMEELIASMQEAVRIIAGEVPPSRVHTASEMAARAAARAAKQE
jgi:hypothetical protein